MVTAMPEPTHLVLAASDGQITDFDPPAVPDVDHVAAYACELLTRHRRVDNVTGIDRHDAGVKPQRSMASIRRRSTGVSSRS
jgi:hypothetical protein